MCDCHIHKWPRLAAGSSEVADSWLQVEEGWRMAAAEGDMEAATKWELAQGRRLRRRLQRRLQ